MMQADHPFKVNGWSVSFLELAFYFGCPGVNAFGGFVFETILYGAGTAALSLIGNATQGACGLVIAAVLVNVLSSNKKIRGLSGLEKRG